LANVAFSGDYNDLNDKPMTNGSETKVSAGTNVSVTGDGTGASPYVINSTGTITGTTIPGNNPGDMQYWNGTDWVIVPAGSNGQILSLIDGVPSWGSILSLFDGDSDVDSDGYTANEGDCNDAKAAINPGAIEICGDGIDQDCDGNDCENFDNDRDGYTPNEGDCNDANYFIHPGAIEICNDGKDQDCNGSDLICDGCFEVSTAPVILRPNSHITIEVSIENPAGPGGVHVMTDIIKIPIESVDISEGTTTGYISLENDGNIGEYIGYIHIYLDFGNGIVCDRYISVIATRY
jgi:hypothetical protein